MRDATEIIIRPLLTEKSILLQRLNKFTFEVAKDATKIEIRNAIEQLGRCEVESVNTLIVKGKVPPGGNRKDGIEWWRSRKGGIEMYDRARYFTITGKHVNVITLEIT